MMWLNRNVTTLNYALTFKYYMNIDYLLMFNPLAKLRSSLRAQHFAIMVSMIPMFLEKSLIQIPFFISLSREMTKIHNFIIFIN